jgi:hypothetical protein
MAMKTSGIPSRIWDFRVKQILSPMEDVDLQYRMAHDFQNEMTAVDLERRQTYRAYRSTIPEYALVEKPYLELEQQLTAIREEIQLTRQKARKAVDTPELDLKAAAVIAELSKQNELLSAAKKKARLDPGLMEVGRLADVKAATDVKAIREDYSKRGLAWGTRGMVEQAVQAAKKSKCDPKIRRWDGRGRIGVQLQGKGLSSELKTTGHQISVDQKRLRELRKELGSESTVVKEFAERLDRAKQMRYAQKSPENRGLPVGDLAEDTRLQIVVPPEITYQAASTRRGDRRRAARTTLKMRIGSTPKGAPIWVECQVVMHRQLPADGIIKWAWIKRRMLGTHEIYHLQLVIEAPSFEQKVSIVNREEAVALDVGWRVRDKNVLRIGYLLDTLGTRREILLPSTVVSRLKHADGLRSTQDEALDVAKASLLEWISINQEIQPAWFKDIFQFLAQSRSSKRLAWNVREWGRRRFAGDSLIYDEMVAWRRQYLHLYEWEVNERAGALAERKNFFRHKALEIAKCYQNLLMEDFKLTKVVENAQPEEEDDNPQTQRHNRVMSALSEFRQVLMSTCAAWSCQIWKLPAAHTTMDCHACHVEGAKHAKWDAAPAIIHTCQEKCGATWDQDFNAAANLLGGWIKSRKGERAA